MGSHTPSFRAVAQAAGTVKLRVTAVRAVKALSKFYLLPEKEGEHSVRAQSEVVCGPALIEPQEPFGRPHLPENVYWSPPSSFVKAFTTRFL